MGNFATDENCYVSKDGVLLNVIPAIITEVYGYPNITVLGRYTLLAVNAATQLQVISEGFEVWLRTITNDRNGYVLADIAIPAWHQKAISPRGEWIMTYMQEAISLFGLIFIYKGVRN